LKLTLANSQFKQPPASETNLGKVLTSKQPEIDRIGGCHL
jgi:hypothetical protein